MKEKYRDIFSDVDLCPMLGAGRYMLQLEQQKEYAVSLQDDIQNTEYPFVETSRPFPKTAFMYASDLVAALTCEELEAERVFRCYLKDVIDATRKKQQEVLHETFSSRTSMMCIIIRNLKSSVEYRQWETDDDEILDVILSDLSMDCCLMDYFTEEQLDEFDEDLDIEELGLDWKENLAKKEKQK